MTDPNPENIRPDAEPPVPSTEPAPVPEIPTGDDAPTPEELAAYREFKKLNPNVTFKKFSESASEGQRLAQELAAERVRREEAEAEARTLKASSAEQALENELRAEHADWDTMDLSEQELARDNLRLKKENETANSELAGYRQKDKFAEDFRKLVATDEFKDLAGDQQELQTRQLAQPGTPLATIARALLYEKSRQKAADDSIPDRPGLENPTPPHQSPTVGGMDPEELEGLRLRNPREYNRRLKAQVAARQKEARQ